MKKKILSVIISLLIVVMTSSSVFASYDPTGYGYSSYNNIYNGYNVYTGENYYNHSYSGYNGIFHLSSWADDLRIAYDPMCYESMQREVTRGEFFLTGLRAVQRSLDRQGYTRLMAGYIRAPFSDYNTVNPTAQGEVNVLYANGILKGMPDNTMRFSQPLTREEAAAIYSRFNYIYFNMGIGYNQWNYDGYNNYYNNNYNNYYYNYAFDDINGCWGIQEIITAASNGVLRGVGYIPGVGNNCFDPHGKLTIEQIWKMLDCCVGYQGLRRSDIAYAMSQTFKIKFGKNIDESYGTSSGTKITRLSASSSIVSIREGETKNIKVTISPTKASYQKLQWSFENYSDYNYATIEEAWNSSSGTANVRVYGKKAKSSYITLVGRAMDGSGKTVSIKLKITDGYDYDYDYGYDDEYITSIVPSQSTIYLDAGESVQLSAKILPTDASYKKLTWTSSNTRVADATDVYVSGNYSYATINANSEGTANIYVRAQDGSGEQETIKVIVNDSYSSNNSVVNSASANPSYVDMNVGNTKNVAISLYPTTAMDKNVNYISDDTSVVKVEKLSNTSIRIVGVGIGRTNVRVISAATGEEICVIPITINGNQSLDNIAPKVEIKGANVIKRDEFVTLTVKAYDENLASFELRKSDILGLTGVGVSVHDIKRISNTEYQVVLLGVEVSIGEVCIAPGVAIDKAGNVSEETDGVVIKVLALD